MTTKTTLPPWFKQQIPDTDKTGILKRSFEDLHLNTVCQSAHCPNMGKCWSKGTATFMILGDTCTRSCRFCAVKNGVPKLVDPGEPRNLALTVRSLGLDYAVVTSVTRDDLPDGGAKHFADTICAIKDISPKTKIEVLVPDLFGYIDNLRIVVKTKPDVISHNLETVFRLSKKIRPQADYFRSLAVLRMIKELDAKLITKSGFMVGMGETFLDIRKAMEDLKAAGCDILTIGQYLAPSKNERHIPVRRYITPEEFDTYKHVGLSMGFKYIVSGPLVRSSYLAEESYKGCINAAK